ncbi:MAG TPA: outer membrane lipoprotein-sorting protein [Candidatus Angelobacter sp.]|nr:outer membrane lipoprotein-sorting protein [Candidatus Angelobacter sp.]
MRSTIWGFVVFLLLDGLVLAQQPAAPDLNTIVSRMMAVRRQNHDRTKAYTVKRDYQLLDRQSQPKAKVVADITYLPPDQKQYRIESSSGGLGERILRDILAKETESSKEAQRKEVSPENYDFKLVGEEMFNGRRCFVLSMQPKRQEKDMLRGKLWVDAETYNLYRIEGQVVKSPSWWVRDLYILMSFACIDGVWLHTATHAVADVRFKGKYVMDSHDVQYSPAPQTTAFARNSYH